jgi:hypothetical protein
VNRYLNQDQTGPQRIRQSDNQAVRQSGGRASGVGGVGINSEPKPKPLPKASKSGRNIGLPSKSR